MIRRSFLLRIMESGSDLLSRAVSSQVPSARGGLTSVFGMGTGDPSSHSHRKSSVVSQSRFFASPPRSCFRSPASVPPRSASASLSLRFRFLPAFLGHTLKTAHSESDLELQHPFSFLDQALDRLVSASSIRYRTSTADLSTLSSSRGLTYFK